MQRIANTSFSCAHPQPASRPAALRRHTAAIIRRGRGHVAIFSTLLSSQAQPPTSGPLVRIPMPATHMKSLRSFLGCRRGVSPYRDGAATSIGSCYRRPVWDFRRASLAIILPHAGEAALHSYLEEAWPAELVVSYFRPRGPTVSCARCSRVADCTQCSLQLLAASRPCCPSPCCWFQHTRHHNSPRSLPTSRH